MEYSIVKRGVKTVRRFVERLRIPSFMKENAEKADGRVIRSKATPVTLPIITGAHKEKDEPNRTAADRKE
jgi:hypothetical protein